MTETGRPHAPNGMQMNFPFPSQVKVAVKQVSNDDLDSLRSLQRELNILSKLRSKYIVHLYGSVVENRDQAEFHSLQRHTFFKTEKRPCFFESRGAIWKLAIHESETKTTNRGLAQGLTHISVLRSTRTKNNCGDGSD